MEKILKLIDEDPEEAKKMMAGMVAEMNAKEEELKAMKEDQMLQNRNGRRVPLSRQRGVDKIPSFSGKGFLSFQKKFIGFAQDEPGLASILRLISRKYRDKEVNAILMDEIADEADRTDAPIKILSSEVHSLLSQVTNDVPWSIVDSAEGNGLEAWRLLCREFGAITSEGKRQIMRKILHPPQAQDYKSIRDHETEWNALRAK